MSDNVKIIGNVKRFLPTSSIYSGCTADHSFMITNDGKVHALGYNNHGQLGVGDESNRSTPTQVTYFEENMIDVIQIASGRCHTLFLSKKGEIFSCGFNDYGQLGQGDRTKRNIPEKIQALSNMKVVEVACGDYSSYSLTGEGKVYSFGYNINSQLGLGNAVSRNTPVLISFPGSGLGRDGDTRICRICAGSRHVAVLSLDKRTIYTFGSNGSGQLGRDWDNKNPVAFPRLEKRTVSAFGRSSPVQLGRDGDNKNPVAVTEGLPQEKMIEQVLCGYEHTTVIYSKNEVYSFGCNYNGELGIGNTTTQKRPVRVDFFKEKPLNTISVGGHHTICMLENGECVGYGYNGRYLLNTGDTNNRISPTALPAKIDDQAIVEVVCGYWHTLFLCENSKCYGVGGKIAFNTVSDIDIPKKLISNVLVNAKPLANRFLGLDFISYEIEEQELTEETRSAERIYVGKGKDLNWMINKISRVHETIITLRNSIYSSFTHVHHILSSTLLCLFISLLSKYILISPSHQSSHKG